MLFQILFLTIIVYFAFKAATNLFAAIRQDDRYTRSRAKFNRVRRDEPRNIFREPARQYASQSYGNSYGGRYRDIEDAKWVDVS